MIYILILTVVILSILLAYMFFHNRSITRQIKHISKKLHQISTDKSEENLKLFTSDTEIQSLLQNINEIILDKRQLEVTNTRYQHSMRKMLSNISHDLKTPLTVINGYIESLQANHNLTTEDKNAMLEKAHNRSKELIYLVNAFFDLAKLESEDMMLTLERIEVSQICKENILKFYDIVTSKNLEMSVEIPDCNYYIKGNSDALHRILQNLISNAVQHGSDGNIIGLKLCCENNDISITIWDKGRGVAEKHRENVFERLYTFDDSRNKEYQGSGLGLTITKRLAENMNGHISLVSKPYALTEFKISFPKLTL